MSGGAGGTPDPAGRDLRAAEYVLGTLDADERAAFERERAADPAAEAAVRAWERRLAPLARAVPEAEPGGGVWQGIAGRIARTGAATNAADSAPAHAEAPPAGVPGPGPDSAANDNRLRDLRRQLRLWRFTAAGTGLVAAGLALLVLTGGPRPGSGQPEAKGEGEDRYVAVVTSAGDLPALIVSVDTAAGTARVRPVAAQAPSGRSLELWYVGPGAAPKPLGLLGDEATRLRLPPEAGRSGAGLIAVSVEPPGGSPTGQPTGQVIYTGKLIRE